MELQSKYGAGSFECPHCGVVSQQTWFNLVRASLMFRSLVTQHFLDYRRHIDHYQQKSISDFVESLNGELPRILSTFIPKSFSISTCGSCDDICLWIVKDMVYPKVVLMDPPNEDLSEEIRDLYLEASSICVESPKGAVALLRLALQKLLIQIGKSGKDINKDIKELVAEGLSVKLQQSLDLLRVVGNNAVHPGQIDFEDNGDVAVQMFRILNVIADELISKPRAIDRLYSEIIPPETREHIQERDGK